MRFLGFSPTKGMGSPVTRAGTLGDRLARARSRASSDADSSDSSSIVEVA